MFANTVKIGRKDKEKAPMRLDDSLSSHLLEYLGTQATRDIKVPSI